MCNITFDTTKGFHSMHELQLSDHCNSQEACLVPLHHSFPVWFHVLEMGGKNMELFQPAIDSFMLCPDIGFHFSVNSVFSHVWCPKLPVTSMSCIASNSFIITQLGAQAFSKNYTVMFPSYEWTINPDNE